MTHYLTLAEAAALTNLKAETVLKWAEHDGLLPIQKHSDGEIFVDHDELRAVAEFRLTELRKGNRYWKDEWKVLRRLREHLQ